MPRSLLPRAAALAATALVALAAPAGAHPFFDPDEAPADSVAELTLDLAHGCTDEAGHDDDGEGLPTREVALEVPAAVSHVAVSAPTGWTVDVEEDDDGRAEVVVLTADDDAAQPAPRFDLEAVHRGEVGEEVPWRVVQDCGEVVHRWVGTADEPAEDPAVPVLLTEADPDAPPPPEDALEGSDDGVSADGDTAEEDAADGASADGDAASEDGAADVGAEDEDPDAAAAEDEGGGGLPGWLLVVLLGAVLAIAGVLLARRSRAADGPRGGEPGGGA